MCPPSYLVMPITECLYKGWKKSRSPYFSKTSRTLLQADHILTWSKLLATGSWFFNEKNICRIPFGTEWRQYFRMRSLLLSIVRYLIFSTWTTFCYFKLRIRLSFFRKFYQWNKTDCSPCFLGIVFLTNSSWDHEIIVLPSKSFFYSCLSEHSETFLNPKGHSGLPRTNPLR